jgi:hypothetical protein
MPQGCCRARRRVCHFVIHPRRVGSSFWRCKPSQNKPVGDCCLDGWEDKRQGFCTVIDRTQKRTRVKKTWSFDPWLFGSYGWAIFSRSTGPDIEKNTTVQPCAEAYTCALFPTAARPINCRRDPRRTLAFKSPSKGAHARVLNRYMLSRLLYDKPACIRGDLLRAAVSGRLHHWSI